MTMVGTTTTTKCSPCSAYTMKSLRTAYIRNIIRNIDTAQQGKVATRDVAYSMNVDTTHKQHVENLDIDLVNFNPNLITETYYNSQRNSRDMLVKTMYCMIEYTTAGRQL